MRKLIAIVAGLSILAIANYGIYQRETLLENGRTVLLRLAPVDPRSLMQGDYMALRFEAARHIGSGGNNRNSRDGHIVLKVDGQSVGQFVRLDTGAPLAADELRMRYRVRNGTVKFATNAYFFQEGTADRYAAARFGEFRVGHDGEAILTGMYDEHLRKM